MAWVKLHTDIVNDPKLMRAARKGARGLEWTPWLIAFAKRANDNGRLTVAGEAAEPEDMAAGFPGAKPATVSACLDSLETLGVLERGDDGVLCFVAWDRRAGRISDKPEHVRDRVTRHRQKRREEHGVTAAGVTHGNGSSNAIETRYTDKCNALEVEEEKEEESPPTPRAADAAPEQGTGAEPGPDVPAAVRAVLEHYHARHPASRPFTDSNRGKVRGRLRDGYSVADLCEAIDGNAADTWCVEHRKHELEYVLRNSSQVDRFRALAVAPTATNGAKPPESPARRLLDVLDSAGLTHNGLGRDAYRAKVDEVAPNVGYEPEAFRVLVKAIRPWELAAIQFPPERLREVERRLSAVGSAS
jgi:hypothetical protein